MMTCREQSLTISMGALQTNSYLMGAIKMWNTMRIKQPAKMRCLKMMRTPMSSTLRTLLI